MTLQPDVSSVKRQRILLPTECSTRQRYRRTRCRSKRQILTLRLDPFSGGGSSRLAGHLGTLLRNVGYSQVIDLLLDAEVASARGLVERQAA